MATSSPDEYQSSGMLVSYRRNRADIDMSTASRNPSRSVLAVVLSNRGSDELEARQRPNAPDDNSSE
jgi:hypothetical protein